MAADPQLASALIDPLAPLLGYQLRRASAVMFADLTRSLAPLGLRPTESSALLCIEANPGVTQSEIGKMLAIQRANMAPLTAALDDKGLIARAQVNGRSHGLTVTGAGADVCGQVRAIIAEHERRFTAGLSPQAYQRLIVELAALWA